MALAGVDRILDLEKPLPFEDESVEIVYGSHILEHIRNLLPLMEDLHRVAMPGARAIFQVPYGSSDIADEDPTHVRRFFLQSFGYFSQPFYWQADYGYRGDWKTIEAELWVGGEYRESSAQQVLDDVYRFRNIVQQMVVMMECVKPIRPREKELQDTFKVAVRLVD